jgi:hypothetical protein
MIPGVYFTKPKSYITARRGNRGIDDDHVSQFIDGSIAPQNISVIRTRLKGDHLATLTHAFCGKNRVVARVCADVHKGHSRPQQA